MYYPKSQIKPNLYTNGEEYQIASSGEFYKGYYYEVSNGDKFTGRTPQDGPNQKLKIPNDNLPSNSGIDEFYTQIIKNEEKNDYKFDSFQVRNLPKNFQPQPTSKDYNLGEFQRYFFKKNNELKYHETNLETFNLLSNKDPNIAWELYTPLSISWKLKGEKENTYNTNRNIVNLASISYKWYGFEQYFKKDFLKYYLED